MHIRMFDLGARFLPGICLSIAISIASFGLQFLEQLLFGQVWIEALVLAIILGLLCRSFFPLEARFDEGIGFSGKILLEIAVMLLGASMSMAAIINGGWLLFAGIAVIVIMSIILGYSIARLFKLSPNLSLLISCGNSICGNSAIAAIAPVIDAKNEEVAASIAFTAVMGVIVVICLPFLIPLMGFSDTQYGIFAGLTVYAVPQVLAATSPVSVIAVHSGTIVKLIRVLMLGPVILGIGILRKQSSGHHIGINKLVPWFIIGFILMIILRSVGVIPDILVHPLNIITVILTNISMAALGLGVELRSVAKSGVRVIMAALLSLLVLGCLAMPLSFLVAS